MNKSIPLTFPIVPESGPVRRLVTLQDVRRALLLDLPKGTIKEPHWREAGWALVRAEKSGKRKDVLAATKSLRIALEQEGWLFRVTNEERLRRLHDRLKMIKVDLGEMSQRISCR